MGRFLQTGSAELLCACSTWCSGLRARTDRRWSHRGDFRATYPRSRPTSEFTKAMKTRRKAARSGGVKGLSASFAGGLRPPLTPPDLAASGQLGGADAPAKLR